MPTGVPANYTIPNDLCTLQSCSLVQGPFPYVPTLAGNALFAVIFGVLLVLQVFFGISHRTWAILGAMFCGLALELIGYVARVQMHFNPFPSNPFLIYLICLTIALTFISACLYLSFARVVVSYGEHLSSFPPRFYTILFISSDFLCLLLQAGGGAVVEIANDFSLEHIGIHIMVAGLALQAVSLALFIVLSVHFAWRCSRRPYDWDTQHKGVRRTRRFRIFLCAVGLATLTILIRSSFRVAELSQGFHGKLWNDQVTFMVLESTMVAIACISLTAIHPGVAFKGNWQAANFKMKRAKGRTVIGV